MSSARLVVSGLAAAASTASPSARSAVPVQSVEARTGRPRASSTTSSASLSLPSACDRLVVKVGWTSVVGSGVSFMLEP